MGQPGCDYADNVRTLTTADLAVPKKVGIIRRSA
jgi:hypothetical protein